MRSSNPSCLPCPRATMTCHSRRYPYCYLQLEASQCRPAMYKTSQRLSFGLISTKSIVSNRSVLMRTIDISITLNEATISETFCQKPIQTIKMGATSWIEVQRVYRAFWRLILDFDLVPIVKPTEGYTSNVWDLLQNETPKCMERAPRLHRSERGLGESDSQGEEVNCILDFLSAFSKMTVPSSSQPPRLSQLPITEVIDMATPATPATPTPSQSYQREWQSSARITFL